ncbi:MAG: hypothetical protein IJ338_08550 [Bacteroidaceae bacterium]|nr:hypothetical protein [Bacteroidaceae bacterium]
MKTNKITPAQLKAIHAILNRNGLMTQKEEIVYSVSGGRTTSSRELTRTEAKEMIMYFNRHDARQSEIRNIWHLARNMGMIYGTTPEDNRMNAAKIDMFLKSRGTIKKAINQQSLAELKITHRQFEGMHRKYVEKEEKAGHLQHLNELLRIASTNEDYGACATLKKEIESITPKKKRKNERISIK